jgi:membrane protease YdiL (CAAX protease family)
MMHQASLAIERRGAWRALRIFLTLIVALSSVFYVLMAMQGAMNSLIVTGIMWVPGIAAILTCLYLKRSISSLPWSWGEWKWNWYAWALPIAYGLVMYLPVWLFGLGGSAFGNPETLSSWTSQITGSTEYSLPAVIFFVFLTGTIGIVGSASRALGEEIGWRGFMIWEMRKVMPFWAVGIMSGLIWGLWHWPGILLTDYNAGEGNLVLQMVLFSLSIIPQGIIYAYFSFKSNSLWPAVILHASHNLFIQRVYTPLTISGDGTHFYIDEFGILLPIVSCVVAVYFYRRAKAEGL